MLAGDGRGRGCRRVEGRGPGEANYSSIRKVFEQPGNPVYVLSPPPYDLRHMLFSRLCRERGGLGDTAQSQEDAEEEGVGTGEGLMTATLVAGPTQGVSQAKGLAV